MVICYLLLSIIYYLLSIIYYLLSIIYYLLSIIDYLFVLTHDMNINTSCLTSQPLRGGLPPCASHSASLPPCGQCVAFPFPWCSPASSLSFTKPPSCAWPLRAHVPHVAFPTQGFLHMSFSLLVAFSLHGPLLQRMKWYLLFLFMLPFFFLYYFIIVVFDLFIYLF